MPRRSACDTHSCAGVLYFAVRDLADGSLTLRKHAPISLVSEPIQFYFVATLIGAVAVFIAARIIEAALTVAGR